MEAERKQLNELREKYQRLVDVINEDSFKEFQKYVVDEITEGLKEEFISTYHSTTPERRKSIDNQAIFVSGFNNLLTGIKSTVEQVDIELARLDEDEEVA